MKRDNLTSVLAGLARELNIAINLKEVYDELLIHPDYPSLLAVSDVLRNFNISSAAYRVTHDEVKNFPCPFIVHSYYNNGEFLLVHSMTDKAVTVSSGKWKRHKVSLKDFEIGFNSIVLVAEAASSSLLKRRSVFLSKSIRPLSITLLVAAIISCVTFNTVLGANISWQVIMLALVKFAGLAVSVLLLIQSIDNDNPLVQKLCQTGTKNNCNDILSSKAAKVFGFNSLSWSEIGFFYFSSTLLFLLFGGAAPHVLQILELVNLACLPYTFYSLYYQVKIARQFCLLCCSIQALLWLEFIATVSLPHHLAVSPYSSEISLLATAILLPIAVWLLIKPLLLNQQQIHPLKVQLQKFKYNADLFEKTLTEQPRYTEPSEDWSIVLGNTEAEHVITMVSNPYCPPCAKMHKALHELLEQRADMQARIVFVATNHDDDIKTPVSRHMMTLNSLADKNIVKKALYDWYEQKKKSYEAWAKTYPVESNANEIHKIDRQRAWCDIVEVTATPTMLLDGYKLPEEYQLADLKYMLL